MGSDEISGKLRCSGCGNFVPAVARDGNLVLVGGEECYDCGGSEFTTVGD